MTMPDMTGWPEEAIRAWEEASEEDRLRSQTSLSRIVEEDKADPETPDHFHVELTAFSVEVETE